MKIFLLLLSFALPVAAAEVTPQALIKDMEGVYKHRFKNGVIAPGKAPMEDDQAYESENIVEIVRYDEEHVYVRAELQYYNGHSCSISGIAGYEKQGFVFHDPEPAFAGAPSCKLKVSLNNDKLLLTDREPDNGESSCRAYCGMRGTLSNISMDKSTRRPIRYMNLIVKSRQYRKAIEDLQRYEASIGSRATSVNGARK